MLHNVTQLDAAAGMIMTRMVAEATVLVVETMAVKVVEVDEVDVAVEVVVDRDADEAAESRPLRNPLNIGAPRRLHLANRKP